jgi:MFS family permease
LLRASKETLNLWRDRKARLILIANFLLVVGSGVTWLAVPWFLIQQPNGNGVYGLSSSALTLLIFLLLPFLGKAIDRNSRKKILLGYYVFALVTNLFVIGMILLQGRVETWHLVMAMTFGSLGVSVYYPAQFAFNQEVLSRDQYRAMSGAIEVQWQSGAMIAGGLATLLINRVPLAAILVPSTAARISRISVSCRAFPTPATRSWMQTPGRHGTSCWKDLPICGSVPGYRLFCWEVSCRFSG